jgi:transketolase
VPAEETVFPSELDALAVAVIRGLAMDAPLAANSGHQGTAMALAPLAHVLFSRVMRYDPADPTWMDRDRFILSAGHASILQYALLHLSGIALDIDDLRAFRQWGSATPGHPEAGHTAGVEVTTGPLGQGFADAVGMAIAERVLAERFGRPVVDHHSWVIAGDGCLMEGVSHEAASLAGHLGLDRLVCVFDDNRITIDGSTDLTCSDDVAGRFRAYGWHVEELGEIGEDLDALERALRDAAVPNGKPRLLILRTHIGYPSPDHTDSHAAHGLAFSADDVSRTKAVMGIPDEPFHVPTHLLDAYRRHTSQRGARLRSQWAERATGLDDDPEWAAVVDGRPATDDWAAPLPHWDIGAKVATRKAIQAAIDTYGPARPADANPAKQLAMRLYDKVPVIYGAEVTAGTAFRWKCQFNENAKQPAFWATLPEMNHNEIVGWEQAGDFGATAQVVVLRDPRQHRQVERRIALTRQIISPHVSDLITIEVEGAEEARVLAGLVELVESGMGEPLE